MSHHLARFRLFAIIALFAGLPIRGLTLAADDEPIVDFSSQIRPILATHCWACHGPDEKSRTADLRLDIRENALAAGAIVPMDLSAS